MDRLSRNAVGVLVAVVSTASCAGTPQVGWCQNDVEALMEPHVFGAWDYPRGECPWITVPAIFERADATGVALDAVVVTVHGIHPVVYSLFLDGTLVLNHLYFGSTQAKGHAPYVPAEVARLINSIESEMDCVGRAPVNDLDLLGDLLVYRVDGRLRYCINPMMRGGETIRKAFWSRFETRIVWQEPDNSAHN